MNWFLEHPLILFLPYLVVYGIAWIFQIPTVVVRTVFQCLHAISFLFFLWSAFKRRDSVKWSAISFWVGLFLAFLLPGAYLEYPSDPWEHVRRIFLFNSAPTPFAHLHALKFAYFFNWTFVGQVPILYRRLALGFVGAFWQWLMTFAFSRLLDRVGITGRWKYAQVIAFVLLFGTNLFSMRYYALSSTLLGLASYFCFLALLFRCPPSRASIFLLLYYVLLCALNHVQTLLYCGVAVVVFFAVSRVRRKYLKPAIALLVLGFLQGVITKTYFPALYTRMEFDHFTFFGGFQFWKSHSRFIETWGVHGILGLLLAFRVRKKNPELFWLVFAPLFLYIFPPTALLITLTFRSDTPYRLLYIFPTSYFLVWGLKEWAGEKRFALICLGVLLLSLPMIYPWRGRAFFQFYRPPRDREFVFIDQTAVWFSQHPEILKRCYLMGDDPTTFIVYAHLGLPSPVISRLPPLRIMDRYEDRAFFDWTPPQSLRLSDSWICGVLYPKKNAYPRPPPSSVAALSRHWPAHLGGLDAYLRRRSIWDLEKMAVEEYGWKKIDVPPFYTLLLDRWAPLP